MYENFWCFSCRSWETDSKIHTQNLRIQNSQNKSWKTTKFMADDWLDSQDASDNTGWCLSVVPDSSCLLCGPLEASVWLKAQEIGVLLIHVGDPNWILNPWLWPAPALDVASIRRANPQMEMCPLSLSFASSHFPFLCGYVSFKYIHLFWKNFKS